MDVDSKRRSLVKSITHRIVAVIILTVVVWLITGSMQETTLITLAFNTVQVVTYYMHERSWEKINWGRSRNAKCVAS